MADTALAAPIAMVTDAGTCGVMAGAADSLSHFAFRTSQRTDRLRTEAVSDGASRWSVRSVWKTKLRRVINITAPLTAVVMVATGLLLKFVMPPGSCGGRGLELWGLGRHDWGDLHYLCSLVLGGLLLLHLLLRRDEAAPAKAVVAPAVSSTNAGDNWPITKRSGILLLAGATAIILGFLWIASLNLTRSATGTHSDQCTGERRRATSQPTGVSVEKTTFTR